MLIDNPDVTIEELMTVIPGPDFPTGGTIMGRDGIRSAYETGRGSLTVRGKAHIEQTSTGRTRIIITEIPYQVNKSKLVTKIADLVREKKLTEISDLRDESDRKGMRVVIELKQACIPQVVLNKLFKHTQLQQGFGVIMLSLVDGVPRTLDAQGDAPLLHRAPEGSHHPAHPVRAAQGRRSAPTSSRATSSRSTTSTKSSRSSAGPRPTHEAKARLIERFGLSEIQTDAILEMRLRRLTGLERHKIEDELAELREKIEWYQKVLGDMNLVLQIIKDELGELREKFANKRRTEISAAAKDLDVEDLIAEEDMVVTITKAGYVKRLPVATYRQQKRGGKGLQGVNLRDNDFVEHLFIASTHDYVLIFSTQGQGLPHEGARAAGRVAARARHGGGEPAAVRAEREDRGGHQHQDVQPGRVPDVRDHARHGEEDRHPGLRPHRRDGIIAINLRDDDELISVRRVRTGEKVMMVSTVRQGDQVGRVRSPPDGPRHHGRQRHEHQDGRADARAWRSRPPGSELFVVTERGYGKRTPSRTIRSTTAAARA